jgi:hypothetical protein
MAEMQDVIEELIGTEIVDETDQFVDNLRSEKVRAIFFESSSSSLVNSPTTISPNVVR